MSNVEAIKKAFPNMFRPLKWHYYSGETEYGIGGWLYNNGTGKTYHIYNVSDKYPTDHPFYVKELYDQFKTLEGAQDAVRVRDEHDIFLRLEPDFLTTLLQRENGETLETYYERQIEWSRETFGPALRTKGIIDHIKKELREIEADPHDLSEWVDVVILAMDGFWRHGGNASDLFAALLAKQKKNMARTWPDWRTMSEDTAIEHDRTKDALASAGEHHAE